MFVGDLPPMEREEVWVQKAWPNFIESARSTLTDMLTMNYPEEEKDEIAQALIDDASLGRKPIKTMVVPPNLIN